MPEIDKNNQAADADASQDAGENSQAGADNNQADNANDGDENADKGADDKEGGSGDDNTSQSEDDKDKAKAPDKKDTQSDNDDKDDKDDGLEPSTRKVLNKQDFIIGRQKAKLSKAKAKADDAGDNDAGDDNDNEVAPEDEALINKVVSKNFAPIIEKTQSAEDDRDVKDFLAENPDFKPFEAKVRRYIKHPSRSHLPVKAIFYEVAGDKLMKIGADRKGKADEEAKTSQTGGGSNRAGGEGGKNINDMTKEEFEAEQNRVRQGN